VLAVVVWSWDASCGHCSRLIVLPMGTMMPETCRDKRLIINIRLVATFWFLSLYLE
jgi:hypothetical protein